MGIDDIVSDDFKYARNVRVRGKLAPYGKVEILQVSNNRVGVKLTEGFTSSFEDTIQVGKVMMSFL